MKKFITRKPTIWIKKVSYKNCPSINVQKRLPEKFFRILNRSKEISKKAVKVCNLDKTRPCLRLENVFSIKSHLGSAQSALAN